MRTIILLFAFFIFSCEEAPLFNEDNKSPVTDFITSANKVFDTQTVTLEWQANEFARIFDYVLQYDSFIPNGSVLTWEDTTSTNSVTFDHLNEGSYTFTINGRYDLDNIEDKGQYTFLDECEGMCGV